MKKCPFCGAEIEENARFCLYCMTSLEEKQCIKNVTGNKKRWPWILAAVFVLAFACMIAFLFINQTSARKNPADSSQQAHGSLPSDDNDNDDTDDTHGDTPDDTPDDAPDDE